MSEATFEAATVEEALEQAATQLGAERDQLEYEVIEEKRDFWGTGGDTVVVKAWAHTAVEETSTPEPAPQAEPEEPAPAVEVADETPAPAAAADAAAQHGEPEAATESAGGAFWGGGEEAIETSTPEATVEVETPPSADEPAAAEAPTAAPEDAAPVTAPPAEAPAAGDVEEKDIVALLEQIFHDMEFDCSVDVEAQPDGFLAAVNGADKELLLEGNGRCLSALELILNNAFRHKLERGQKVRVDAGDFRSRREEELTDLAFQVAHSAKEAGRTQETQPLNPYERRLVHLALAEDPAVTTRSRGSGFLKNVQVIPERRGGRGRRS